MILVTGGTGFIGKALIRQLTAMRLPVRTLLRPSKQSPALPPGVPVEATVCSLHDERGLLAAMKGVDTIFHLAGAERQSLRADLNGVDVEGTGMVAQAAAHSGVRRFIYVSHLGADRDSAFAVLKAKALAENLIRRSGLPFTILRSAVVFGPGDQFFEGLAALLRRAPGIFLLPEKGASLVQPLWVEDLVTVMTMVMDDAQYEHQTLDIGGAETLSLHQVVQILLKRIKRRRMLINLSPVYVRGLAIWLEHGRNFPMPIYWLDYLASDRTCPLDTLPRRFGLMPARLHQQLEYIQ